MNIYDTSKSDMWYGAKPIMRIDLGSSNFVSSFRYGVNHQFNRQRKTDSELLLSTLEVVYDTWDQRERIECRNENLCRCGSHHQNRVNLFLALLSCGT